MIISFKEMLVDRCSSIDNFIEERISKREPLPVRDLKMDLLLVEDTEELEIRSSFS